MSDDVITVSPSELWFSQRTAGGNGRAKKLRASIRKQGFIYDPANPVTVIRTPNGLTTIDNTRVAVAQELQLDKITVVVKNYDESLPPIMVKARRFGEAKTWGEALRYRTSHQRPEPLPPYGTPVRPYMPKDDEP